MTVTLSVATFDVWVKILKFTCQEIKPRELTKVKRISIMFLKLYFVLKIGKIDS